MMDGAIAQPFYVSEYGAEKVPFDDAVALEDFLYKGTKALMEDTIFYVTDASLKTLNVTSEAGTSTGKTKITVTPALTSGNSYKYKAAANPTITIFCPVVAVISSVPFQAVYPDVQTASYSGIVGLAAALYL